MQIAPRGLTSYVLPSKIQWVLLLHANYATRLLMLLLLRPSQKVTDQQNLIFDPLLHDI
jgi:hypothetical protein